MDFSVPFLLASLRTLRRGKPVSGMLAGVVKSSFEFYRLTSVTMLVPGQNVPIQPLMMEPHSDLVRLRIPEPERSSAAAFWSARSPGQLAPGWVVVWTCFSMRIETCV